MICWLLLVAVDAAVWLLVVDVWLQAGCCLLVVGYLLVGRGRLVGILVSPGGVAE